MKKGIILVVLVIVTISFGSACSNAERPQSREDAFTNKEEENNESSGKTGKTEENEAPLVKLPDVSGTDVDSAKAVLISKGFLITIVEDYSDSVKAGDVIGTNPKGGELLEENSKVVLLVSKGPSMVTSKDATMEWYNIDSEAKDKWNFGCPFIFEEKLYIECETTFGTDFRFKGNGFGNASITDNFDKKAPITLLDTSLQELDEEKEVKKGTAEHFVICIPLAQLDSERPTHVACELVILIGDKQQVIKVSFNISW